MLYHLFLDTAGHDVVEVFGPSGSGKTTTALLIAKEALSEGKKVIYIDTEMNLDEKMVEKLRAGGLEYYYMTSDAEIFNFLQNEPKADVYILDSLGMPILRRFARANAKERGEMLLRAIAISGTLKELSKKNHALVLITNQPESEFGKAGANEMTLAPFGDKHVFDVKEIWRSKIVARGVSSTVISVFAWRSRKFGYGKEIFRLAITDRGVKLKVLAKEQIEEGEQNAEGQEIEG